MEGGREGAGRKGGRQYHSPAHSEHLRLQGAAAGANREKSTLLSGNREKSTHTRTR